MILEKIIDDPTSVPREELQRRIMQSFSGVDRTLAVLELSAIYRRYRHIKWVRTLLTSSDSNDVALAVNEWSPLVDGEGQPAVFYRYGRTGCELDGAPIRKIFIYRNRGNENKLRIGSVCAQKIDSGNIFGDAYQGVGDPSLVSDHLEGNFVSIIDWLTKNDDDIKIPDDVQVIAARLLQDEDAEISEREKNVLIDFYNTNRLSLPSELIGESDLLSLRQTMASLRTHLPVEVRDILYTNERITRKQAEPLVNFLYADHAQLIGKLRENKNARRLIDQTKARLEFVFPGLEDMGKLVLSYIKDYESVNRDKRHRLSGLVLPIRFLQTGLFMTEDDARQVQRAYELHKDYSRGQLEADRDGRYAELRRERWASSGYVQRKAAFSAFMTRLVREIDMNPLADDMWKVINGVAKSANTGSRTGYVTKPELLRDPIDMRYLESNLRSFLLAGFGGSGFGYRDRVYYDSGTGSVNNFPDTFMGNCANYAIPDRIREIAFNDASQIKSKDRARATLASRKIALNVLQDLVMEVTRRYRYRPRSS
jgi:hypothetical protein